MNKYEEILNLFTTTETSRYTLSIPFYFDEWAVATDGHVAAIVDRSLVPELPEYKGTPPNIKLIMPTSIAPGINIPTSVLVNEDAEKAQADYQIARANYEEKECPKCEGTGVCECDCGDEHDCPKCDGEGFLGEAEPKKPIEHFFSLHGRAFAYKPLAKVRRAAEALGVAEIEFSNGGPNNVAVFRFDALTVLAMPARPTHYHTVTELLETV